MRSLMIATAMCAAALTFTGCSFTVSGPCTSLSHQARLGDCGCQGGSCATCGPTQLMNSCKGQPECGTVNFGDGAPCGLEGASLGGLFRGSACDGGCGGGCGSCSGSGVTGQLGMRRFDRGTACANDGCGDCATGNCSGGLLGGGIRVPGSRVRGAMGSLGSRSANRGCGRFGCGRDGKLCMTCRVRSGRLGGLMPATAGEIPHTAEPNMGGGPGMVPQYVYPYYTTRGPRDFLMANPPSIGY